MTISPLYSNGQRASLGFSGTGQLYHGCAVGKYAEIVTLSCQLLAVPLLQGVTTAHSSAFLIWPDGGKKVTIQYKLML